MTCRHKLTMELALIHLWERFNPPFWLYESARPDFAPGRRTPLLEGLLWNLARHCQQTNGRVDCFWNWDDFSI